MCSVAYFAPQLSVDNLDSRIYNNIVGCDGHSPTTSLSRRLEMAIKTRGPLSPTVYVTAEHGIYDVDSATYPGLMSYVVDLRCPTCHTCSCPAFAKWGGPCKHITAAREFEADLLVARAWADF